MDNWNYTCRSCLSTAESFSYCIYKDITPETYLYCTSVEIKYDELPKSLCGNCYHLLLKFSEFKKMCIESENKLLGFAKNVTVKNEPRVEVKVEIKECKVDEDATNECYIQFDVEDEAKTDRPDSVVVKDSAKSVLPPTKPRKKILKAVKQKRIYDFKCERCDRSFPFKERLEGHMLEHEGIVAPILCKICNKTYKNWGGLRYHVESVHSQQPFSEVTCPVCCKVYKSSYSLKSHQKTHERRERVCDECGRTYKSDVTFKVYKSSYSLKSHQKTHERRERVCDECGRTYKSDVTFKMHLETHIKNRERNFTCEHCGKKYISQQTLRRHVYRRHTDRQFICNYCNYIFTDKAILIRHVMIHEGRHPKFECDVCSRLLTSQASLVLHKRIHSGEKPFSCGHCGKKFSDKAVMTDHERVHTGEKPFACAVCDLKFSRRTNRQRHMKVHK